MNEHAASKAGAYTRNDDFAADATPLWELITSLCIIIIICMWTSRRQVDVLDCSSPAFDLSWTTFITATVWTYSSTREVVQQIGGASAVDRDDADQYGA